jgi:hypothetical protein
MDNFLLWAQSQFQEEYVEVLVEIELFTESALKTIRESNAGNYSEAKASHVRADVFHKEASRLLTELDNRFRKTTAGRNLPEWTREERDNNDRLRSLGKWMSSTASLLLDIHKISLKELQPQLTEGL